MALGVPLWTSDKPNQPEVPNTSCALIAPRAACCKAQLGLGSGILAGAAAGREVEPEDRQLHHQRPRHLHREEDAHADGAAAWGQGVRPLGREAAEGSCAEGRGAQEDNEDEDEEEVALAMTTMVPSRRTRRGWRPLSCRTPSATAARPLLTM